MSARDMREACAKGRDALASLWAAIGDRLCAGKPLDTAYAQRVAEECRAASRALEDVVPYGEIPMGAAPAPIATECGHESMTGLGHPRLWSCDGCGEITVEVDDQNGQSSDGTRRWRREVIGRVDVKAARRFGPPMPAASAPADDAVARARERWERASRRYFDARLALAAAYDLASLNVAEVGERAAAREAGDAYTALLAAERAAPATDDAVARALRDIKAMSLGHHAHEDSAVLLHALLVEIPTAIDAALLAAERAAKGGEKEATQGTCSRCGYLAMPPACTKCYSPYPAPAPRDGGAKGGSEGGERG